MKEPFVIVAVVAICLCIGVFSAPLPAISSGYAPNSGVAYNMEELEDLVAPIALYPDPLVAQILPAATYVDQLDDAARFLATYGSHAPIDNQNWDVSVKAVAHYPKLLRMMVRKYNWTVALGQAFINQPDDLMYAMQLLRQDARDMGNLVSTPQQQVVVENGYISVIPATPEVIYIPAYNPRVVYVQRPSPRGFIQFSVGFTIGAWLNRDCDWRGGRVFYHGWHGRPWVDRARPHVQINNTIYINNVQNNVVINRTVMRHNNEHFRQQIRHDLVKRHEDQRPPNLKRIGAGRQDMHGMPSGPRPAPGMPLPPDAAHRRDQRPNGFDKPGHPGKPVNPPVSQLHGPVPPSGQVVPIKGDNPTMRHDQRFNKRDTHGHADKPVNQVVTQPRGAGPVLPSGQGPSVKNNNQTLHPGQPPRKGPQANPVVPGQPQRGKVDKHPEQQQRPVQPLPGIAPGINQQPRQSMDNRGAMPKTPPLAPQKNRPSDGQNFNHDRGRDHNAPASHPGYGASGNTGDAVTNRERGKPGQGNIHPPHAPPAQQHPAPPVPPRVITAPRPSPTQRLQQNAKPAEPAKKEPTPQHAGPKPEHGNKEKHNHDEGAPH